MAPARRGDWLPSLPGRGDQLRGGGGVWLAGERGFKFFILFFYFISYIHGMQNLHLFLLGHMREPLAKIIIYEAREREGERGREGREGGRKGERSKRLSIIRDTGDAH